MKKIHQQQLITAIIWVGTAIAISINPEKWMIPMIIGYFATASSLKLLKEKQQIDNKKDSVVLSWGIVHNQFHKMGFGTYLLRYRLKHIMKNYPNTNIVLDTSQKTYKFYERFNFKVDKITSDFYRKGLDRYDMSLIK